MAKKVAPEELTVEELHRLLVERRRSARHGRLEHFRRTGRVVSLVSDVEVASLDKMHSGQFEQPEVEHKRSAWDRLFNAILLAVEVSAVIGLIVLMYTFFKNISFTNEEYAKNNILPTLTPTPLIMAVVLPSGHTPPNSPGGAQPNEAEIPEHLRPLVQSLANVPIPTPAPEQANRIQIPAIGVDASIVLGDGWEQLKKGVGQHIGSANPGEKNNVVLTAHNDVFGEIFRDLEKLKPGDQIILFTSQHAYTYIVTGSKIVQPSEVEVMAPTTEAIVTLITCYPYMVDNMRIVVVGYLQGSNR